MAKKEEEIIRMPPQSTDAEMAALGALMIDRHAANTVFELLDDTCFYREANRNIFIAAKKIYERSEPIDIVTISAELEKSQELEKIGGKYYLTELVERMPSAANVERYCRIVLDKALFRKLIDITSQIQEDCYEASQEAFDLIDTAEHKIFQLSESRHRGDFAHIHPILHQTMEKVESFHDIKDGITGVPTGFINMDKMLSGLQDSELVILASRPSMGKTALALNIARNAAGRGVPVGIFSLEMANYQLAMRLLCSEAKVDSHLVRTGQLPKNQFPRLSNAAGVLARLPIYIDDSAGINIIEIRSKARRLKAEYKIGLLVIDYLQLIRGTGRVESRQIEIAMISQSLKALAKELAIPVLALSQLSRAPEMRSSGDRKPLLSDLRESGAIEQDADVVMFIYRASAYGQVEPEIENIAEIIVAKQRNGPTGAMELVFVKDFVLFANKEHQQPELKTLDRDAF